MKRKTSNEILFKILGEGGSGKKKRHRKASTEGGSHMRELQNAISGQGASSETDKVEVWFHEDCISWMSDVRLVGHVILGNKFICISHIFQGFFIYHSVLINLHNSIKLYILSGLEDAISSSRKAICFKCNLPGSTLGCISVGCRELAHFHCAKEAHWAIDENNFQARCSRHKPPT